MSSGIKSADRDMTGPSKSKGGGGMSMQRNWMGCGHNHTQGTLRNGIPWLCAACVQKGSERPDDRANLDPTARDTR